MLSLLPDFEPAWPSFVSRFLRVFAIASLDISGIFNPQCAIRAGSGTAYVRVWAFKMVLPLMILLVFGLFATCIKLYNCIAASAAFTRISLLPVLSAERLRRVQLLLANACLLSMSIIYASICSVALSVFRCTRNASGLFLAAEPSIDCHSNLHRNLRIVSFVQLGLFGVAFPVSLVFMLWLCRGVLFWRESYQMSLGMLFKKYRAAMYLFEGVALARKLAFVIGVVLFDVKSAGPLAWALAATCLFVITLLLAKPYKDPVVARLELLAQSCTIFVLSLGLVFLAAKSRLSRRASSTLGVLVLAAVMFTLLVILAGITFSLLRLRDLSKRGLKYVRRMTGQYLSCNLRT